jgi:hypothetical protein
MARTRKARTRAAGAPSPPGVSPELVAGGVARAGREGEPSGRPAGTAQAAGAAGLLDLIVWIRGRLAALRSATPSEYTRSTLQALERACDPGTNPRLRRCLEDLDHPARPEGR